MHSAFIPLCLAGFLTCCQTRPHQIAAPELRSPVALQDAVLTLPSDALSGLTQRQEFLRAKSGRYDETRRRIWSYGDNPHEGGDTQSMLYLRLFEDASGHTIAASHAARPFADHSEPSEAWTRVYRLVNGAWVDISQAAFAPSIPRKAYFRFDSPGESVAYGLYTLQPRRDGGGDFYNFGPPLGHLEWRDGAFQIKTGANKVTPSNQ